MENKAKGIQSLDHPLVAIKRKDHTDFFVNCPISKTGFSISGTIDMESSADYPLCLACQYNNGCGGCAYARRKAGVPDDARLIGFNTNAAKQPIQATIEIRGETFTTNLEPGRDMGKSIIDIWEELLPESATFLNLRTGRYVRISKNPKVQFNTYHGKCYGWISSDGYSFSRDSVQLFGISNSCWACTWYKKNGQGFPGPFGYKFPI